VDDRPLAGCVPSGSDGSSARTTRAGAAMEITDVKVFPVDEDKLKAYVTITLDHCFVIRDLKVIHGSNGLFIAMPAKRRKDGTYKDIAHPLNADTRDKMERVILNEYDKTRKKGELFEPGESAA
jgi:stage V sporulation protein G